jgi:hypothetical protein
MTTDARSAIGRDNVERRAKIPSREFITDDTPLRLGVAAALAFPDGSMTASGLRREAGRGRLVTERIAGKDYTTLRAIAEMRELCRRNTRGRASGCDQQEKQGGADRAKLFGSSSINDINRARAAAEMIVRELQERSLTTSTGSISKRRAKASVIPLKSPSPMS